VSLSTDEEIYATAMDANSRDYSSQEVPMMDFPITVITHITTQHFNFSNITAER